MILGFMGKAGSGKDTAAQILYEHSYRVSVRLDSFAAPIYQGLAAMLDMDVEHLQDRSLKEREMPLLGKSPRYMLQTLGTEWGRDIIHQDIWALLAMHRHDNWLARNAINPDTGVTIITDVRFENEADMVQNTGGMLVHIERPGVAPVNAHISENGVDYSRADFHIINGGDLDSLRDTLLRSLGSVVGVY